MKRLISSIKKILINGGLFVLVLFLTYHFVFSRLNTDNILELIRGFNPVFLILAILSIVFMLALETLTIKLNLKNLGEENSFLSCFKYTFAGNFFSAITPAASGGQPMQILLMNKDGIKTEKSTLALMMDLSAYQLAIVSFSLVAFIAFFRDVLNAFGSLYPLVIVGIVFNALLLLLIMTVIFSKKLIYRIVALYITALKIFKYKKYDAVEKLAMQWVARYKYSAEVIKHHRSATMINILLMFLRIALMFTAPVWVYMGLGFSGESILFILAMQAILHVSCAALPLPGGVGINETIFLLCFGTVFPQTIIGSAMLLCRGIGFYAVTAISGISLVITYFKSKIPSNLKLEGLR